MTKKQIENILSDCRVDHLYTTPVDYDWSAHEVSCSWSYWEAVECEKCGTPVVFNDGGGGLRHNEVEGIKCKGYVGTSEGPMMSYWYPCKIDKSELGDAAIKIAKLPLCIVCIEDSSTGLALTGGGMDLTWEICAAYLKCGHLPPLHFSERLPKMAGPSHHDSKLILAAAKMSAEIAIKWHVRTLEDLVDMKKWVKKYDRRYK